MTTSPDSQISSQTPKQDGVEEEKTSLDIPKQLRRAIPSVPQALPATPALDHYGDDTAEFNSAEDADTETDKESENQIQGQVQLQDQDQFEPPSKLTTSERSKKPLVREEDEKPSSDPEVVIEQEPKISHGPLTANRPSDDDKVEHVKDDSLIPDGQHITLENDQYSDSVVNEEEVSDATLNDPTACCTQPNEPIKKASLAGVNAEEEEEEEETVCCNVIGRTTGRPCGFLASKCPHHRDN